MDALQVPRPISPGQRAKIFACARALGWDDAKLHEELERVIGVSSIRELSHDHARLFIDFLISEGAPSIRRRPEWGPRDEAQAGPLPANVVQLASPAQRELIHSLLADVGWTLETDYFKGCLAKANGRSRIRTLKEASRAITILQKIKARRQESMADAGPESGDGARPA